VKPAPRWPLHPAPREGEALSSWLNRVAACYRMDVHELLAHDLGHDQLDDLDTEPPLSLLTMIAQRSGVELERLREMSLAGWVPWLLDSLEDSLPAALETYAFQCSVLLPKRKARSITRWRAWLPSQPMRRACPLCLNDPVNQAVLLVWQLPLMLSCPQHGCWLASYWGLPGRHLQWDNAEAAPCPANAAIAGMDRRTWQALTTGFVELPRRRIHAGLWFRLLRTLLDELNTPLSHCGGSAGCIRQVWEHCGHPLRAGQSLWRQRGLHPPGLGALRPSAACGAKPVAALRGAGPGRAGADAGSRSHRHRADRVEGAVPARGTRPAVPGRTADGLHQWPAREETETRTRQPLATGGPGHW